MLAYEKRRAPGVIVYTWRHRGTLNEPRTLV